MPIHHLSNVDLETKTAICSVCGPTDIHYAGGSRWCGNKQRETLRKRYGRQRAEYLQTHKPQKRGRKPGPPKEKPAPQPRVYGTHAHVLSEIDDVFKTAVCSVCGPVKIYVFKHENYTTRRCSKANSQNVTAARKVRETSNREFVDKYKVEQGCQRCGYNASPLGLDLHHRNPAEKDFAIASAVTHSRERLVQELDKCDVLCAICHRLVHDELGYTYE